MRSHSRSASSTSWVTSTTVVPWSRTRATSSQVWRRATGSRFWVSSSRNTSRGRPTSASATNSRWRSPPDSVAERPAQQRLQAATSRPARASRRGAGWSDANRRSASPTRIRSGRAASWSCAPIGGRSRSPARAGRGPAPRRGPRRAAGRPWRISTVVVLPAPLRAERGRTARPRRPRTTGRGAPAGRRTTCCRSWTSIGRVGRCRRKLGRRRPASHIGPRARPCASARGRSLRRLRPRACRASTTPWS